MYPRVRIDGKHLVLADQSFRVRGVTYGSFRPRADGLPFPDRMQIKSDLESMAALGLNTLRTYSLPPVDLLEFAAEVGLRVLVGLDYDDWRMVTGTGRSARREILQNGRRAVEEAMAICAGNPTVLAIAVGNEIPIDLVRVHGAGSVQETLSRLIADVHAADPEMPATYVNFPTSEFMDVEGQDLVSFNVFLEGPDQMRRYLRHLQVVSGDKPLLLTELGLASDLHGVDEQARTLDWQLRLVDETGCAGATIFSWTDEWAVAGSPVEGWGFGITAADRTPKPAVSVVEAWARSNPPRQLRTDWPMVSVVVCAYNEERTIEECLSSLAACDYPNLEVIVCDDGSTDRTLELARRFPFAVLELPHAGLSTARNAGWRAAKGDIVAYLDADAACHPEWPYHLVLSMNSGNVAATGGPNPPFEGMGLVERAVALSPGRPMEVLLSADRAEHVPGCNMAFRRHALEEIGGFDPAYTAAGDDVDVCWKLLDRGYEIAYSPAAQIRHHRRNTIRGYLRQQRGYGRAERMLSGPHRHRFNRLGQARWTGFIYGGTPFLPSLLRPVVYHGQQGMAPFQSVQRRRAELAHNWVSAWLPLVVPVAVAGGALAFLREWWLLIPTLMLLLLIGYGVNAATVTPSDGESRPIGLRLLVGLLHVLQPFARVWGRLRGKPNGSRPVSNPTWSGDRTAWLSALCHELEAGGSTVHVGQSNQSWDLEVRSGFLVVARLTTAVAWRWEPRWRVGLHPRPLLWLVEATGILAGMAGFVLGYAMMAVALVGAVLDGLLLKRQVDRTIALTTEGARG